MQHRYDEGHNIEDVCRDGASMEVKSEDLSLAAQELEDVVKYFEEAEHALRLLRPFATWVKEELRSAKQHAVQGGRASLGGWSQPGQPVRAAPGDKIWKGEEAVAAVCAALSPSSDIIRKMRGAKMGSTDQECVRVHVRMVIREAAAASSFNGELMRAINQSVGKFGAKGLTMTNQVCLALVGYGSTH